MLRRPCLKQDDLTVKSRGLLQVHTLALLGTAPSAHLYFELHFNFPNCIFHALDHAAVYNLQQPQCVKLTQFSFLTFSKMMSTIPSDSEDSPTHPAASHCHSRARCLDAVLEWYVLHCACSTTSRPLRYMPSTPRTLTRRTYATSRTSTWTSTSRPPRARRRARPPAHNLRQLRRRRLRRAPQRPAVPRAREGDAPRRGLREQHGSAGPRWDLRVRRGAVGRRVVDAHQPVERAAAAPRVRRPAGRCGVVACDFDDDGEHAAGKELLRLLEQVGAANVCAMVSRWWGGILLERCASSTSTGARAVLVANGLI